MPRFPFRSIIPEENLRKLAGRTVETYPTEWRVVHEALQNAKDAIRRGNRPGTIRIELDVSRQSVTVSDDGIGFPPDRNLLGFGGTDKDDDPDAGIAGRQGVGLKAVILATSAFRLSSVHERQSWTLRIDNADTYLQGADPDFDMSDPVPSEEPPGTQLEYEFRNTPVTEMLTDVLAQHLEDVDDALAVDRLERLKFALEIYFRSYTYAGDVNALLGVLPGPEIRVVLVIRSTGAPTGQLHSDLADQLETNPIEAEFPAKHWDVEEAVARTARGRPRATVLSQVLPPGGSLGRYGESYLYVGKLATDAGYRGLLDNPNLRRPIDALQYQRLFEQLRGVYVAIGSRAVLERYLGGAPRQFIAADGTPSAHVLPGPQRGGEATYVANNIHFIANVDAKLNYGKQTIPNPRLVGQVASFFADAVRATLRNVAISIVGSQLTTSTADDLEDRLMTEQDVVARPLLANGHLYFKREPRDEDAVIAIFFELIGRGFLSGFEFYSMSQKARYDGRAAISLVGESSVPVPQVDAELRNVEFKVDLMSLIDDFEHEYKLPQDIQLIVVWNDALRADVVDYQVVDIEHTEDADRRMDGVEKGLHCKRQQRMVQMIVLSDLVRDPRVVGNNVSRVSEALDEPR
jgi:hypothetical protein